VSLNDVAAETAVGFHGKFEVDRGAFANARKRGAFPGFGREVGAERAGLDIERGQADAAYGNALTSSQFLWRVPSRDRDSAALTALLDFGDRAYFLDDSGEHEGPPKTL